MRAKGGDTIALSIPRWNHYDSDRYIWLNDNDIVDTTEVPFYYIENFDQDNPSHTGKWNFIIMTEVKDYGTIFHHYNEGIQYRIAGNFDGILVYGENTAPVVSGTVPTIHTPDKFSDITVRVNDDMTIADSMSYTITHYPTFVSTTLKKRVAASSSTKMLFDLMSQKATEGWVGTDSLCIDFKDDEGAVTKHAIYFTILPAIVFPIVNYQARVLPDTTIAFQWDNNIDFWKQDCWIVSRNLIADTELASDTVSLLNTDSSVANFTPAFNIDSFPQEIISYIKIFSQTDTSIIANSFALSSTIKEFSVTSEPQAYPTYPKFNIVYPFFPVTGTKLYKSTDGVNFSEINSIYSDKDIIPGETYWYYAIPGSRDEAFYSPGIFGSDTVVYEAVDQAPRARGSSYYNMPSDIYKYLAIEKTELVFDDRDSIFSFSFDAHEFINVSEDSTYIYFENTNHNWTETQRLTFSASDSRGNRLDTALYFQRTINNPPNFIIKNLDVNLCVDTFLTISNYRSACFDDHTPKDRIIVEMKKLHGGFDVLEFNDSSFIIGNFADTAAVGALEFTLDDEMGLSKQFVVSISFCRNNVLGPQLMPQSHFDLISSNLRLYPNEAESVTLYRASNIVFNMSENKLDKLNWIFEENQHFEVGLHKYSGEEGNDENNCIMLSSKHTGYIGPDTITFSVYDHCGNGGIRYIPFNADYRKKKLVTFDSIPLLEYYVKEPVPAINIKDYISLQEGVSYEELDFAMESYFDLVTYEVIDDSLLYIYPTDSTLGVDFKFSFYAYYDVYDAEYDSSYTQRAVQYINTKIHPARNVAPVTKDVSPIIISLADTLPSIPISHFASDDYNEAKELLISYSSNEILGIQKRDSVLAPYFIDTAKTGIDTILLKLTDCVGLHSSKEIVFVIVNESDEFNIEVADEKIETYETVFPPVLLRAKLGEVIIPDELLSWNFSHSNRFISTYDTTLHVSVTNTDWFGADTINIRCQYSPETIDSTFLILTRRDSDVFIDHITENACMYNVFPTIVKDYVNISGVDKKLTIQIIDINGRVLMQVQGNNNMQLDLSQLKPAYYKVLLINDNIIRGFSILKQ